MRTMTFALILAAAFAAVAQAQTAAPSATAASPAAAPPAAAPAPSGNDRLSHQCKEEVKKACGHAHGTEMQDCIKSSLDLNKFSASCKAEIQKTPKPSG